MVAQWVTEFAVWWQGLSPEMTFLFSLPFIVAAVGLIADRSRRPPPR